MHLARLSSYLSGGRAPGAARVHPGCRDRRPPRRAVPALLTGQLYFALESRTWTGGMGFYDPSEEGELPVRAYLLSTRQFADIAAQEMARAPGAELDLREVLTAGRARLGPGRYETLVCAGLLDGLPVLTFTAPWRRADAALNRPAAAYLAHLGAGLREAHGWGNGRIAAYLSSRPGAAGEWTPAEVEGLLPADDRP
ncbi:histone deacetylase [Kitasatospora sp. NPDC057015]|uniref:histone deacetylase n=1 Tax=Kitasatospora sp. NPDC057015 TaxID=3346001 RepID=UPI0036337815